MSTRKQQSANRRNAKQSTGPTTPEGKATASRNAVTHGLHATAIVLKSPHHDEDPEEYQHLLASLIWELKPEGVLQHHLVHKITNALWRYRRVIRAETGFIQYNLDDLFDETFTHLSDRPDLESEEGQAEYQAELDHRREIFINRKSLPNSRDSLTLLRYELRLDRQTNPLLQDAPHPAIPRRNKIATRSTPR